MFTHVHTHPYIFVLHTHTHTHTHIYIYMCLCIYIHVYIYIYEYILFNYKHPPHVYIWLLQSHLVGGCQIKCGIIWRVLDICDRAIE